MEIKVENGKWNVKDAFLDLFINSKREIKNVSRSKITKEHNYKFKKQKNGGINNLLFCFDNFGCGSFKMEFVEP